MIINVVEKMKKTRSGNHVGGQLLRSGTSPVFHHGEAEAAESSKDFIHKLRVCLKELRESKRALRLAQKAQLIESDTIIDPTLNETEELIKIFVVSIRTAQRNAMDYIQPSKQES
ncbi:four helix bundle protein [bacterium]|nr:four helix bundle protein [bacterium]